MLCGPDKVPDLLASPVLWGSQPSQPEPTPHNSLVDIIQTNAEGPAEAHGDSGGMKQHSLQDQIAADRYLESKRASRAKGLGVRLTKVVPPGAA